MATQSNPAPQSVSFSNSSNPPNQKSSPEQVLEAHPRVLEGPDPLGLDRRAPMRDARMWALIALAFLFDRQNVPLRSVVIKAVALRLALSADEHGSGDMPHVSLLASELELSILDAAQAVLTLTGIGLLVTDLEQPWAAQIGVDEGRYQLTVTGQMTGNPNLRQSEDVLNDADAILDEYRRLRAGDDSATPETILYRWYDADNVLLYIGITGNLLTRQSSHDKKSSWVQFAVRSTVERFPTRANAEWAETNAIKTERPLFNRQHNDTPEARQRLVDYLVQHGRTDLLAPAVSRG